MRRLPVVVALVLCASLLSCTIWENPPKGWAGATGGEQLERQFWNEVAQQHWTSVQRRLASNFVLTTPSGFYGPEEALDYWKQLPLQHYALGDFQVQPNGADVTVAYTLTLGQSNGQNTDADPAYVMSVWQEVGPRWILIAQSLHLNKPRP